MRFSEHIKDLLFTEECVIVPGFGAFITQYIPAEIREDNHMISPPSKVLGFNSELVEDDGILNSQLCLALGKSTEEVSSIIAGEVGILLDNLSLGRSVTLTGIGSFTMGRDNQISFKADKGVNYHLDSYGFAPFTYPILEAEKPSPFKNPIIFRQPSPQKVRENLPGSKPPKVTDKYASYLVGVAVIAFLLISLVPYNSRVSDALFRHPASLGPLPSLTELDPPIEENISVESQTLIQPVEEDYQRSDLLPAKSFPIIAGSFQSLSNAEILARDLKNKGYEARVESAKNFYRVILMEYQDLQEAEAGLTALQESLPELNLWVKK
jgi:hypothetical protein